MSEESLICSFCNKSRKDVTKMIVGGSKTAICNECVKLCVEILDEDIANRTPDEQRKALKISGLMSVLVASKKLKRAISTIEDYDLPDDPELRQVSAALSDWLSRNLVIE